MSKENYLESDARPEYSGRPQPSAQVKERPGTDSNRRSPALDLTRSKDTDSMKPALSGFSYLNNPQTISGSEVPHTIRANESRLNTPVPDTTNRNASQAIIDTITLPYRLLKSLVVNDASARVDIKRDVGTDAQTTSLILNGQNPAEKVRTSVSRIMDLPRSRIEPQKVYDVVPKQTVSNDPGKQGNNEKSLFLVTPHLLEMLYPQVNVQDSAQHKSDKKDTYKNVNVSDSEVEDNDSRDKPKSVSLVLPSDESSEDGSYSYAGSNLTESSKCTNLFEVISQHVMSITSPGQSIDGNSTSTTRFPKQDSLAFSDSPLLGGRRGSDVLAGVDSDNKIQSDQDFANSYGQINFEENLRSISQQTCQHANMPFSSIQDSKTTLGPGSNASDLLEKMSIHDLLAKKYARDKPILQMSNPSLDIIPIVQTANTPSIRELISNISLQNLLEENYAKENTSDPILIENGIGLIKPAKVEVTGQKVNSACTIKLCAKESLHDLHDEEKPVEYLPTSNHSMQENKRSDTVDQGQSSCSPNALQLQSLMSKHGLLVQKSVNEKDALSPPTRTRSTPTECSEENDVSVKESTPTIVLYREKSLIPSDERRPKKETVLPEQGLNINDYDTTSSMGYLFKRDERGNLLEIQPSDEQFSFDETRMQRLTQNKECKSPIDIPAVQMRTKPEWLGLSTHRGTEESHNESNSISPLPRFTSLSNWRSRIPVKSGQSKSESLEESVDPMDDDFEFDPMPRRKRSKQIFSKRSSKMSQGSIPVDSVDKSMTIITFPESNLSNPSSTSSSMAPMPRRYRSVSQNIEEIAGTTPESSIHDPSSIITIPTSNRSSDSSSMEPMPRRNTMPIRSVSQSVEVRVATMPASISYLGRKSSMAPSSASENREASIGSTQAEDSADESSSLLPSVVLRSPTESSESSEQSVATVADDSTDESSTRSPLGFRSATESSESSIGTKSDDSIDHPQIRFDSSSGLACELERATSDITESSDATTPKDMVNTSSGTRSLLKFLTTGLDKSSDVDTKLSEAHGHSKAYKGVSRRISFKDDLTEFPWWEADTVAKPIAAEAAAVKTDSPLDETKQNKDNATTTQAQTKPSRNTMDKKQQSNARVSFNKGEEVGNREKRNENAGSEETATENTFLENILPFIRLLTVPAMDEVFLDTFHLLKGDDGCELCPLRRREDEEQARVIARRNGGERGDDERRGEGGEDERGKQQQQQKDQESSRTK